MADLSLSKINELIRKLPTFCPHYHDGDDDDLWCERCSVECPVDQLIKAAKEIKASIERDEIKAGIIRQSKAVPCGARS